MAPWRAADPLQNEQGGGGGLRMLKKKWLYIAIYKRRAKRRVTYKLKEKRICIREKYRER